VLATCQLALNDKKAAAATADGMLAAAPHAPLSYVTAGRVAETRKDWDGAERYYRDGRALEPGHSELALALARLMERRGRIDEAADAYLAAGRADPTDARARRGLARLGVPVLGGDIWFVVKLLAAAVAVTLIGIWAALTPSPKGGGAGQTIALFVFAAVAMAAATYLHRGPRTRSRAIPGWLRLPYRSRS
jgi:tetratricopeptide (TPR) repeat protein